MSYDGRCMHCEWPHHPGDGLRCRNCGKTWDARGGLEPDTPPVRFGGYDWSTARGKAMDAVAAPAPEAAPLTEESEYRVVGCYDCGLGYGSEGWIECIVPREVWCEISPSHDGAGILCITCIARRLKRAGRDRVPVMLGGTEPIIAAGQDEAFNRGWGAAQRRMDELESALRAALAERDALRSELRMAQQEFLEAHAMIREREGSFARCICRLCRDYRAELAPHPAPEVRDGE